MMYLGVESLKALSKEELTEAYNIQRDFTMENTVDITCILELIAYYESDGGGHLCEIKEVVSKLRGLMLKIN